jgi:phosphoglycerate dehydrogenase-like enzyme
VDEPPLRIEDVAVALPGHNLSEPAGCRGAGTGMTRPSVLILAPDAEEYPPLLDGLVRKGTQLTTAASSEEARAAWAGQTVVLGQPDLVAAALDAMAGLRWVQSTWAGVEALLRQGRRDFRLTGVKGVFGPLMAEYVFAHLLAHETKLVQRHRHQGQRNWWTEPSGTLAGKTLGIMGTGSIGCHIARTGKAFGMRVLGFSRSGAAADGFERVFGGDEFFDFLAEPDYLVGVLPGTPATEGLLDASAFSAMRPDCCVVNVGRGSLIDEAALLAALNSGKLGGAVLDVFRHEPLPVDSPLWRASGVTVTAHVAADSRPTDIARIFEANYNRYLAGSTLRYEIDFEKGY